MLTRSGRRCIESESVGVIKRMLTRSGQIQVDSMLESSEETVSTWQLSTRRQRKKGHMESESGSGDDTEDGKCGALHCNIAVYKGSIIKWVQCDSIFMHTALVLRNT